MNRKYILCRLKKVEGRGMGVNPLPFLYHTPLHIRSTYYFSISLSTYLRSTLRLRWVTLGDPLTLIFRYLSVPPTNTMFILWLVQVRSLCLFPLHIVRSSCPFLLRSQSNPPTHRPRMCSFDLVLNYISLYYLPPYNVGYNIFLHPL